MLMVLCFRREKYSPSYGALFDYVAGCWYEKAVIEEVFGAMC